MADNGHFDRLAAGLSLEERQNLLDKLSGQAIVSGEPLYVEESEKVSAAAGTEYSSLPWYYRLWYFVLSFFRARPPDKIFADHQVAALGGRIEAKSPGLYDYQKGLLLPAFYRQMVNLKDAARFFYSALDTSVGRDKGAFFAFLGSLEMADVHRRLEEGTSPGLIVEKNPSLSETEIRQQALKAMDDALSLVNDTHRNAMYFDARALSGLKDLSSFLFDRVIMAFGFNSAVNGQTCSAGIVRELLADLNNVLISLKTVPPLPLLESLFVFSLQERYGEPGFDIGKEIRALLAKAEEALKIIREFNRKVPLTWILRCFSRNMTLAPRQTSGGEDWFLVYRDYWKRNIESSYADFMKDRRRRELLDAFRYFLKGQGLRNLGNTASDSNPDGLPIKGAFALSFLRTFYSAVFMPDINRVLRPILIDGEFLKKENRAEFTESYNRLINLEDDIKKFEWEISPDGDYGQRYFQARQDMSSLPVKRRKVQIVTDEASSDALKIADGIREASQTMIHIVSGILGRDTRNRYFPLVNLSKLAAKNSAIADGMEKTVEKFQRLQKLLDDIEIMELGR